MDGATEKRAQLKKACTYRRTKSKNERILLLKNPPAAQKADMKKGSNPNRRPNKKNRLQKRLNEEKTTSKKGPSSEKDATQIVLTKQRAHREKWPISKKGPTKKVSDYFCELMKFCRVPHFVPGYCARITFEVPYKKNPKFHLKKFEFTFENTS